MAAEQEPEEKNVGIVLGIIAQEADAKKGVYPYHIIAASAAGRLVMIGTVLPKPHVEADAPAATNVGVMASNDTPDGKLDIHFSKTYEPPLEDDAARRTAVEELAGYAAMALLGRFEAHRIEPPISISEDTPAEPPEA